MMEYFSVDRLMNIIKKWNFDDKLHLRRLPTVSTTFPTDYSLKNEYYHSLSSDATIMVSHKSWNH